MSNMSSYVQKTIVVQPLVVSALSQEEQNDFAARVSRSRRSASFSIADVEKIGAADSKREFLVTVVREKRVYGKSLIASSRSSPRLARASPIKQPWTEVFRSPRQACMPKATKREQESLTFTVGQHPTARNRNPFSSAGPEARAL
jgi:hypothetical protein